MRRMNNQTREDFLKMIFMLQNRTPKTVGTNKNREDIEWLCSIAFSCGLSEQFTSDLIPALGWDKTLSKDWPSDKTLSEYNYIPLVHECYYRYRRALLESFHDQTEPLEHAALMEIV